MFGIGKLLGKVVGGVLEKVGLGSIAPFVKMGLNALTGNWLGVAEDVFNLVSSFKSRDFADRAAKRPPLGNFAAAQRPTAKQTELVNARLDNLVDQLTQLNAGNSPGTLAMLETVRGSFSDTLTASNSFSRAYYSQIRS
ncbi:MAG: hypothetical protein HOP17_04190 [Acidobacteria bacterium]|nr:hypothetical protein [Acidobacteriota bacterium]